MTGNQTDGATPAIGQGGEPNQPSSPAQPKPFDGDANGLLKPLQDYFEQRFTGMEKAFADRLGRVQGTVDRSQNEFRKWMGEVEKLEKSGLSREEAIEELEADHQANQWRSGIEKQLSDIATLLQNGGTLQNKGQTVAEVFSSKGLDVQDPRVAQFLVKQYKTPEEAELAAYRLKDELAKSPNPNPAQSASMNGNNLTSKATPQQIEEKSIRLLRLYDNYDKNAPEIRALEEEIKKYWEGN